MNRPLSLFSAALVALGACIPLGGCRGISSYNDYEDGARNGIVYYLPKTEYEVTFTIAREIKADPVDATKKIQEANIGIGCVPFFVVDRTVGPFTLHSSANEFFTRDHKVKVRDGLLTSVNVNDDGRLAVIAKNLGDAVAMVIAAQADPVGAAALISDAGKSGPGVAGGGADDEAIGLKLPELPAFPDLELVPPRILRNLRLIPTQSEISAMLLQLTPGEHKWHLSQGRESFQLQGASGRISASMATGKGGARDKGGLASSLPYMPARECGSTPGLVARNTTKDGVTITLDVEEGMIAELRRAAAARNVTKLKQHQQKLEEIKQDYDREARILNAKLTEEGVRTNPLGKFPDASADMKTLKKSLRQVEYVQGIIQKRIEVTQGEHDAYDLLELSYKGTAASTEKILLKENAMTVSRTLDERAVVIPLKRGPVGLTTHSVTLDRGVINDWDFTKVSAVEGLVQIPIDLAKAIVGIPAAAVENQTTRATNEAELAQAKTKLTEAEIALVQKQKELEEARAKADKAE